MFVEAGKTKSGREYEIRKGYTGSGRDTYSAQFKNGDSFRGTDLKPLSLKELKHVLKFTV